jgi:hypothetical protein
LKQYHALMAGKQEPRPDMPVSLLAGEFLEWCSYALGKFEDQLADRLCGRPATSLRGNKLVTPTPFPNAATQRARVDDSDNLAQCLAKFSGEANESDRFLFVDRYPRRQLAPQDLVVNLELADLTSEFLVRCARNNAQQRLVNISHGVNQRKLKHHKNNGFVFAPRFAARQATSRRSGLVD